MADTTALKNRIRAAIKANDNQEITGPVLQQALLDMVDELNGATETEASARQNGDSTLQQGINTEKQARIDADSALGQRIDNETQQRQNGDNALQQSINAEKEKVFSASFLLINSGYLSKYNGSVVAYEGYYTSEFVKINKDVNLALTLNVDSSSVGALCYYNSSKAFISCITGPISELSIAIENIPQNAEYIRFCSREKNVTLYNGSIIREAQRAQDAEHVLQQDISHLQTAVRNLRDAGYAFSGIAVVDTNPGIPTGNCFYIVRGTGTYTHFKNADNESIVLENDGIYVLTYESVENNYWEYNCIIPISEELINNSNNLVTSKGIYNSVNSLVYNALSLFSIDGYINPNGKHYDSDSWKHTDFLEISQTEDIIIGNVILGTGANIISFYSFANENNYISGIRGDNSGYIKVLKADIPSNAKYIRVCGIANLTSPFIALYNINSLKAKIENDISKVKDFTLDSSYFVNDGYYISVNDGSLQALSGYKATDFIGINTNFEIAVENISCGTGAKVLAFYNINRGYISEGSITGTGSLQTLRISPNNIPSTAAYIRCSGNSVSNTKIINGTITDKIISLENEIKNTEESTEASLANINSRIDKFEAISTEAFTFINKYISITNGQLFDFNGLNTTDFIFIDKEHNIEVKNVTCPTGARALAFYNINRGYISEGSITGTGSKSNFNVSKESIPEKAAYIRVCASSSNTDVQIINFDLPNDLPTIKENAYKSDPVPPLKILILGDSYSAGGGYWVGPMMEYLPKGSTWISLAVGSAKIRDRYQDRETYPYTSRPVASNDSGNLNNIACQIQKLKRLMAGTDLDEGETQLYTSPEQYPNVIIIEGGHNDWADADSVEATYNAQLCKVVNNVYTKTFPSSDVTLGSACIKTPLDEINRTCYAGAYRYAMDELLQLFPNAQIYITTVSPISYRTSDPTATRIKVAEQQRKCADLFNVTVIDWHRDGQINSIANYTRGSGTEEDPYITAYQSGEYVDTNDQLHPNARGGRKYGRLAARIIRSTFLNIQ